MGIKFTSHTSSKDVTNIKNYTNKNENIDDANGFIQGKGDYKSKDNHKIKIGYICTSG